MDESHKEDHCKAKMLAAQDVHRSSQKQDQSIVDYIRCLERVLMGRKACLAKTKAAFIVWTDARRTEIGTDECSQLQSTLFGCT